MSFLDDHVEARLKKNKKNVFRKHIPKEDPAHILAS